MDFETLVEFLEPRENPPKGPAIIMSSEDFAALKTAIEQACRALGDVCTVEMQAVIERSNEMVEQLGRLP